MSLLFGSFLKKREPRKFNYVPRFYDPHEKEGSKKNEDKQFDPDRLRTKMNDRWDRTSTRSSRQAAQRKTMLLVVLLVLALIMVMFLN